MLISATHREHFGVFYCAAVAELHYFSMKNKKTYISGSDKVIFISLMLQIQSPMQWLRGVISGRGPVTYRTHITTNMWQTSSLTHTQTASEIIHVTGMAPLLCVPSAQCECVSVTPAFLMATLEGSSQCPRQTNSSNFTVRILQTLGTYRHPFLPTNHL